MIQEIKLRNNLVDGGKKAKSKSVFKTMIKFSLPEKYVNVLSVLIWVVDQGV